MIDQIKYRKAKETDVETLIEWRMKFLKNFFKKTDIEENRKLEIEIKRYLQKMLPENSYIAWFAEIDNKIVGIGVMAICYTPPKYSVPNGKIGYILNIYTLYSARRKGIGTNILSRLIKEAKENKVYYLSLQASQDGLNIYKNAGFELVDNEYSLKLDIENLN